MDDIPEKRHCKKDFVVDASELAWRAEVHVSRAISVNDLEESLTGRGEMLLRRRRNPEQKAG